MDSTYFTNPLVFLLQTIFGLYGTLVMLRFLLQLVQADFYNPISQFIVVVTSPALRILRRFIPGFAGMDFASLLLAWCLKVIELMLIILVLGGGLRILSAVLWAIPELVDMAFNIFLIAILVHVVLSWFGTSNYNPVADLAYSLAEPIMALTRHLIPPMPGLDFSPMLASVIIVLLKMLVLPPLQALTGSLF